MADTSDRAPAKEPCTWALDDMNRLRRFLCFGVEAGTYTSDEKDISKSNVQFIINLLQADKGIEVVDEIKKFSCDGRTANQQPILYALALCAKRTEDPKTKQAAYSALMEVCRIPTHIFQFVKFAEQVCESSGWGRAQRNAVASWYDAKDPTLLALYVTKYRQRSGWSHKDLLRLSHLKPTSPATELLVKYVIKGLETTKKDYNDNDKTTEDLKSLLEYLDVVETVKHSRDEAQVAALVEKHNLVHEHVPTWLLKSKTVWKALLPHMPVEAMIRSLGKISTIKLLDPKDPENCVELIIDRLKDTKKIQEARLHPMTILLAWMTYKKGEGEKGKKLKWEPNSDVVTALEQAFHAAFKNITATGKRHLLAVDVSNSMQFGGVRGSTQVSPDVVVAAMIMATIHVEDSCQLVAFSANGITPIQVDKKMTLQEVCHAISEVQMGGTDCALPIKWALENKKAFDAFIVYTDCSSCAPDSQPANMLRNYRKVMDIPDVRLVVCALTSTGTTQADLEDSGILDIAGFDAAAPQIIHNFIEGIL